MKRRCTYCGTRAHCDWPIGPHMACDKCARRLGVTYGKPKNVAEANSRAWNDAPCKHKGNEYSEYFYRGFTKWTQGRCRKCGNVTWGPIKA